MKENEIKPELQALGVEIQKELISIGMDEVEIMNFWNDCYKTAKSQKYAPISFEKFTQN